MGDVLYGCECDCDQHPHGAANAPVAFEVTRDGKRMKVCTRCDFSTDKDKLWLFDKSTPSGPFIEFDALGAVCIALKLDEQVTA
jgi:hypothetical protein